MKYWYKKSKKFFNWIRQLRSKMKKQVIIVILILFGYSLKAQHCGYCGAGIIVLNIKAKNGEKVIPNLQITVLDSLGNTIMKEQRIDEKQLDLPLYFWQNIPRIKYGELDNEYPPHFGGERFWFAKDNYVLEINMLDFENKKLQVKIEDIDGNKNDGYFESQIVDLGLQDLYHLCTYHSDWTSFENEGRNFIKDFKPVEIKLNKLQEERQDYGILIIVIWQVVLLSIVLYERFS